MQVNPVALADNTVHQLASLLTSSVDQDKSSGEIITKGISPICSDNLS